ncbi:MAG: 50S ribosomal protein L21 [Clostridiales bacterium]|nr:50S ribosomal protein L21 [Clostridiales bacterium]
MFAIIETGGKQYRVSVGDVIDVERIEAEEGATIELKVLMTGEGDSIVVGAEAESKKVSATVLKQVKSKKVVVFKYKAKKNVRKKQGHRQFYTRVKIESIA